jgi:RimJ/RimL family protein N-acetyltransferase
LAIELGLAPTHRVICELGSGVVGVISTYTLDQLTTARCQIGFWIGPNGRGKGYGTEAVTAFVEHLHALGTRVIEASTAYTNEPAQRVVEKAGFTLVGGHAHTLPNGETIDGVDYVHVFPASVILRTEPSP